MLHSAFTANCVTCTRNRDVLQSLSHVHLFATPMDCNTPGFPVLYHLPDLLKLTSVESMMSYNHLILCRPLLLLPSILLASESFPKSRLFTSGGQSIGASASVLSMNIWGQSPLGWTCWISLQSKGLSRVSSNTTVQKHQFFGASLLYSPAFTSIHDHWKNHGIFHSLLWCTQSKALVLTMKQK